MLTLLSTKYSEHPIAILRKIVKMLYTIAAKLLFLLYTTLKGAAKSYSVYYLCVFIILFNTGFCRSAFSGILFGKLAFCLPAISVLFVLNQIFWIETLKYMLLLFKKVPVTM